MLAGGRDRQPQLGCAGAGCGPGDPDLPRRRLQQGPEQPRRGHGGTHSGQAAQRPDRSGEGRVPPRADALCQPGAGRRVAAVIRSTVAHVSLAALQANYRALVAHLSAEGGRTTPDVIAVVKANAYGHGAARVALALEAAGATMVACADIEEGVALRRAGVTVPVLVFGALSVSDLDGILDHALTPTISTPFAARAVEAAGAQ